MSRKILLVEPNYKNKYPPMGLMKIATYYRRRGDDVRFFKGDLKRFAAELLFEEYLDELGDLALGKYQSALTEHIKTGKLAPLDVIPDFDGTEARSLLKKYRARYMKKDFPQFDRVGVTTMFTFYWKQIIETIEFVKYFCEPENIMVGGVAATLLADEMYEETGIMPHRGLLDKPGDLDPGDETIIDTLPLDYSILEEIDYVYPASDAYFAYMTRGCVRHCEFCAVPTLEPKYCSYIEVKSKVEEVDRIFGPRRDLLLMDNNVFASRHFNRIIDDIKAAGFEAGASYIPESEYDVALRNLNNGINDRAYRRKLIRIYDNLSRRLKEEELAEFYLEREKRGCLYVATATKEALLEFDAYVKPLYDQHFKPTKRRRCVDFNQGLDARLANDAKMAKLAEINIRPLRIAFDDIEDRDVYVNAIKLAAKHGIGNLSNYLLYNFKDTPDDLYLRLKINVELCEELDIVIYSFPMKYHPITDGEYFKNRDFIGKHWNRKFIRTIQAVLNATKGKIGRGKSFFEEAFGKDLAEFHKILWMPERFIIHRMTYKDTLTKEWWDKFKSLSTSDADEAKAIIGRNRFTEEIISAVTSPAVSEVLTYYMIRRDQ